MVVGRDCYHPLLGAVVLRFKVFGHGFNRSAPPHPKGLPVHRFKHGESNA
jgi:hypothetical protein